VKWDASSTMSGETQKMLKAGVKNLSDATNSTLNRMIADNGTADRLLEPVDLTEE
jgi:hypothetical protein